MEQSLVTLEKVKNLKIFEGIVKRKTKFKIHYHSSHPFLRLKIKIKKKL